MELSDVEGEAAGDLPTKDTPSRRRAPFNTSKKQPREPSKPQQAHPSLPQFPPAYHLTHRSMKSAVVHIKTWDCKPLAKEQELDHFAPPPEPILLTTWTHLLTYYHSPARQSHSFCCSMHNAGSHALLLKPPPPNLLDWRWITWSCKQTQEQEEKVRPIHTRDELIPPRIPKQIWCEFIHKKTLVCFLNKLGDEIVI